MDPISPSCRPTRSRRLPSGRRAVTTASRPSKWLQARRTDRRLRAAALPAAAAELRRLCSHHRRRAGSARHIAAQYVGDPQQFWRLCDSNGAMRPEALVSNVGAMLTITLPEGVPG